MSYFDRSITRRKSADRTELRSDLVSREIFLDRSFGVDICKTSLAFQFHKKIIYTE